MTKEEATVLVEAAERHARELLNQASKYERLGMPSIADETMDLYRPLRDACERFRKEQGL